MKKKCNYLLTYISFQTFITFFPQWSMKEDIWYLYFSLFYKLHRFDQNLSFKIQSVSEHWICNYLVEDAALPLPC